MIVLTVAASLPVQLIVFGRALEKGHPAAEFAGHGYRTYLTADEQSAMLWLRDHARPDDVAVSNVFCMPAPYRPGCPDDAYWISGLSGVRLWMGGWGYAPANLAATDHKTSFLLQPSPWPDRVLDSRIAVEKPSAQQLAKLSADVGVGPGSSAICAPGRCRPSSTSSRTGSSATPTSGSTGCGDRVRIRRQR